MSGGYTSIIECVKELVGSLYGREEAEKFYDKVVNRGINPCELIKKYSLVNNFISNSFYVALQVQWEGHVRRGEIKC